MKIEVLRADNNKVVFSGDCSFIDGNAIVGSGNRLSIEDFPQDIIVNIVASRNFLHYVRKTDQLRIGCVVMYANDWFKNYEAGRAWGYTQQQIDEYEEYVDFIKAISDLRVAE
jgi:hypothetical protein